MQVYLKLKQIDKNVVLAICDDELLGKTLCEGKIIFKVKDEFYNGGKVDVEEAISMIKNANIVNLVGKCCVEHAVQKGYVHPDAVITIQGIPHTQIMKL
ncbi:MAG: DUF424 family protein [Nitrososphaerota archaeon]|jgi:hypothetical protein|uniref:DUF424 domain-containing protein n=1 Tax=Candidatus Bathycorpusculum sp. TaxID=2994959 RepID=UPI00282F4048|nr:DUF424 family protein [Candidatus Termiticorpusculum sp.]MCL2257712.1 DUF424 family protein [Candidatus Termiticorpusculum sp.]MCL2292156.1 DUF424 family protein [Candidatus Termiticorpusculum sp.]MDR0461445.1 DUF424 family protein [Nitrososphaerota archaeon]